MRVISQVYYISGFQVWLRIKTIQAQVQSDSLEGDPEHWYLKASSFGKFIKLLGSNDVSW